MSKAGHACGRALALIIGLLGYHCGSGQQQVQGDAFVGSKAGDEREVRGVKVCWCPAGTFVMGSPPDEPERRPDEDQVEVTLTKGFWMGKYEVTQGQWKRVVGELPGELTVEGGEGDDLPVYNVNYAEAEGFCSKLTDLGRRSGDLPADWEFRLATEAQWEYACRAGTTTATPFGDQLSSTQANFRGDQPYNGAEVGPSLNRAVEVGSYPPNPWGMHDMHGNVVEWCRDWYHAQVARRPRPGSVIGEGNTEPRRHVFTLPPRQRLGRSRLGLPVRLPPAV